MTGFLAELVDIAITAVVAIVVGSALAICVVAIFVQYEEDRARYNQRERERREIDRAIEDLIESSRQ